MQSIAVRRFARLLLVACLLAAALIPTSVTRAEEPEPPIVEPAAPEGDVGDPYGLPDITPDPGAQPEVSPLEPAPDVEGPDVLELTSTSGVPQWHIAQIDDVSGQSVGLWPAIAVKPDVAGHPFADQPVVAYSTDGRALKLAIKTPQTPDGCGGSATGWWCRMVNEEDGVSGQPSLVFKADGSGTFGLLRANRTESFLRLTGFYNDGQPGGTWSFVGYDTVSDEHFRTPSLAFIGSQSLVSFHYNYREDDDRRSDVMIFVPGQEFDSPFTQFMIEYAKRDGDGAPHELGYYMSLDVAYNATLGYTTPRMAYRNSAGWLRYAYWVGDGQGSGCSNGGHAWGYACITIDPVASASYISFYAPKPGIAGDGTMMAYYDHLTRSLKLARYVGGSSRCGNFGLYGSAGWECITIDTIASGQSADNINLELRVDQNGRPTIAYIDKDDRANSIVKIARPAPGGSGGNCGPNGSWWCGTVDAGGTNSHQLMHASLALNSAGRAYVAYHNATTGSLMVATEKAPVSPRFSKSYAPATVEYRQPTQISYTIFNDTGVALSELRFADTLTYQRVTAIQNGCGGSSNIVRGTNSDQLTFSPNPLPQSGLCTIRVTVTAERVGTWNDPTGVLSSAEAHDTPTAGATLTVSKASQYISFPPLADRVVSTGINIPFLLPASASSGLPVSYATDTPAVCTVTGSSASLRGVVGTCRITASQAGNESYRAATPVTRSFEVLPRTRAEQTIDFAPISDQLVIDPPVSLNATASSGLPVTFESATPEVCTVSGATASIVAAGSCTIVAEQAGNTSYQPATASRTFAVHKAQQSISFAPLSDRTVGEPAFSVSASASSGLPVSFIAAGSCTVAGDVVTLEPQAGACTITARQDGDATYAAATPVVQGFVVRNPALASQSIAFAPLPDRLTTDAPFTVAASASSGLPVSFTADGVCTVDASNLVTLSGVAGDCTITAQQPGSEQYNAAAPIARTFLVREPGSAPGDGTGLYRVFMPIVVR